MVLEVKGIVLREVDIGESDKMLTILTESFGRISVFAGGVKRLKSPHFVATQLYTYSEFTLYDSHGKYYIRECSKIESFFGLRDTLEGLSLAAYIADVICDVSLEDEGDDGLLKLVLNSFFCISKKLKSPDMVKAVFELKTAAAIGFMPDLVGCADCGKGSLETYFFDVDDGTFKCEKCFHKSGEIIEGEMRRQSESEGIYFSSHTICPLSHSAMTAMRYVLYCKPERLFAFALKDGADLEFFSVCEKYLLCRLERGFTSLDFYKSIK